MIVNVDRIKPFRGTEEPLWVEGIDNNLIQEDRTPIITDIEGNVISCQEEIPDLRHRTGVEPITEHIENLEPITEHIESVEPITEHLERVEPIKK